METTLQKESIFLPEETLAILSQKAKARGLSLRKYMENILKKNASEENPSPSHDPWFDNSENIKIVNEAKKQIEHGEGKICTMEEINHLLGI